MKRSMVISLIGRPNVGKSSVFNCLMRRTNKAITFDQPGVTRDRHYGIASFDDVLNEERKDTILVDTGGFYPQRIDETTGQKQDQNSNKFFNIMTEHAQLAIEESDLVLFVVDVREGVLPFDESIASYIRTQKKPFWLIINKYDSDSQMGTEAEFYSMGVKPDNMFLTSSAHNLGIEALRTRIHKELIKFENINHSTPGLQKGVTPREQVVSKIALIGAPNAGKSTLLNQLIGSERALVSDIAGTTVDPIEGFFDMYFGKDAGELDAYLESKRTEKNNTLIEQYDDFRKNNQNVYDKILMAYNEEEGFIEGHDEALNLDSIQLDGDIEIESFELSESSENDENKDNAGSTFNVDLACKNVFEAEAEAEAEAEVETSEESVDVEAADLGSFWRSLHIVDTAGIRKQKSVNGFIESQSVFRSLKCIAEADIVIYMVDATKGIGHQDRRLLDIALEKGKSIIVCMNKIDLLKSTLKTDEDRKEWMLNLRDTIPWLSFCDLVPISAKLGKHLKGLRSVLKKTVLIRNRKIPTGELNRHIFHMIEKNPTVVKKSGGKLFKVKYTSMIKNDPPTFLLFSNRSQGIPENFRKYLQNGIREYFGLDNTPIHLIFRTGSDLARRMKKIRSSRELNK